MGWLFGGQHDENTRGGSRESGEMFPVEVVLDGRGVASFGWRDSEKQPELHRAWCKNGLDFKILEGYVYK